MLKHLFAFFAIAAVPAMAGDVQPKLSKVMIFKDWGVACDNGLGCEATTFKAENFPGEGLGLSMTRIAGREGAITITIYGAESTATQYRLLVDRRVVKSGTMVPNAEIEITGNEALKFARALAVGRALRMTDNKGVEVGSLSLAGSSAALRYIDAAQGRTNNNSAIVALGKKAAYGKTVPLPVIEARKVVASQILPDAATIVALSEGSPCANERNGPSEDLVYSLGGDESGNARALVMLNCGNGAYNFSSGVYVGTRASDGKWSFAPAQFDFFDRNMMLQTLPLLVNADWDAASQSLGSFSKGRGVADCGSSGQYVWDGTRFRLTLANRMDECRGSMDWLTVWRADVKFSG